MSADIKTDWIDPSKRAGSLLDSIIHTSHDRTRIAKTEEGFDTIDDAKQGERITKELSDRDALRVVFVTNDVTVLISDSLSQLKFHYLRAVFEEVHVIVLCAQKPGRGSTIRVADGVWLYPTNSTAWWRGPFDVQSIAETHLLFNHFFRPDVIVALDPFESALAGLWLADRYGRTVQVHIREDITDPHFSEYDAKNKWRLYIAHYVLKRVKSVCYELPAVGEYLEKRYAHLADTTMELAHYFDLESILEAKPAVSVKDIYPQFSFVLLVANRLETTAHVRTLIDAVGPLLKRNRQVGLVIIGSGPRRRALQKIITKLGITKQVVFEPWRRDLISYYKTADLYLNAKETETAEHRMLEVVATGLPFVSTPTETLTQLFDDGDAGFFCAADDGECFQIHIERFLAENDLRKRFSYTEQMTLIDRLEQDRASYYLRYRDQIESALVTATV